MAEHLYRKYGQRVYHFSYYDDGSLAVQNDDRSWRSAVDLDFTILNEGRPITAREYQQSRATRQTRQIPKVSRDRRRLEEEAASGFDSGYADYSRGNTSVRRYPTPDKTWEHSQTSGEMDVVHSTRPSVRRRASTQTGSQLPVIYQQPPEGYEDPARQTIVLDKEKRKVQWLLPLALGMLGIVVLGLVFTTILPWWQGVQNRWNYGDKDKSVVVTAVVGHNDSPQHPSVFFCDAYQGYAVITEWPGGNASKAYTVGAVALVSNGNNIPNIPVFITFRDMNGDGKPDLIVTPQGSDTHSIFLNIGSKFQPPPANNSNH